MRYIIIYKLIGKEPKKDIYDELNEIIDIFKRLKSGITFLNGNAINKQKLEIIEQNYDIIDSEGTFIRH